MPDTIGSEILLLLDESEIRTLWCSGTTKFGLRYMASGSCSSQLASKCKPLGRGLREGKLLENLENVVPAAFQQALVSKSYS